MNRKASTEAISNKIRHVLTLSLLVRFAQDRENLKSARMTLKITALCQKVFSSVLSVSNSYSPSMSKRGSFSLPLGCSFSSASRSKIASSRSAFSMCSPSSTRTGVAMMCSPTSLASCLSPIIPPSRVASILCWRCPCSMALSSSAASSLAASARMFSAASSRAFLLL